MSEVRLRPGQLRSSSLYPVLRFRAGQSGHALSRGNDLAFLNQYPAYGASHAKGEGGVVSSFQGAQVPAGLLDRPYGRCLDPYGRGRRRGFRRGRVLPLGPDTAELSAEDDQESQSEARSENDSKI